MRRDASSAHPAFRAASSSWPTVAPCAHFTSSAKISSCGTAFTLATDLNVLPMTIYTEFTLNANIATAAGR